MEIRIDKTPRPIAIEVDQPDAIVNLKAKKTIAGDVMIYDHPDMDIVLVMPLDELDFISNALKIIYPENLKQLRNFHTQIESEKKRKLDR